MKALITNHFLNGRTGSEVWARLMAKKLDADLFSFNGENTYNPDTEYDFALINHNTCLNALKAKAFKKVFTSHGVLPELEQPIFGADLYVAVSEEVQQNLLSQGYESIIIRNPIDTERFKPTKPINETLQNVLFISNYGGDTESIIRSACEGLSFQRIGGGNNIEDVENMINWADLVISLGRGAYEAMSCNRNLIVFDYNGADGFVDMDNVYQYRQNNMSGRTNRIKYTAEQLKGVFKKYNPSLTLRNYVLQNHDSDLIVQQYKDAIDTITNI